MHTSGPWKYHAYTERYAHISDYAEVTSEETGVDVALITFASGLIQEAKANARLIAAAPRMVAELESVYHELRIRCGYQPGDAQYDAIARVLIEAGCDQRLDLSHKAALLQAD